MIVQGTVQNGVVVLESGAALPEGAVVSVIFPAEAPRISATGPRRVQLPLIHSDSPGSIDLTPERLSELLNEDEDERARKFFFGELP